MNPFFQTVRLALQQERIKDYTRAFNYYKTAIDLTKNENSKIKIFTRQAWCLHLVGNPNETEKIFRLVLQEYNHNPWGHLLYAKYLIKTKKYKQAKTLLEKACLQFPEQLELYLTLASLLKDMERSNEAIIVLKTALGQKQLTKGRGIDRKDIWAELGNLFFQRGDYNSSISALKKSLHMDEEETYLHYDILSIAYLYVGDPENSLHFIEKYSRYFGDLDSELLVIKARAHCKLKDFPGACASLLQAYSIEDRLQLSADDMVDLAPLKQMGFLETLENLETED